MFKTKKQLKEEIARLILDIEGLKIDKDIIDNQRKIAEGEMRLSKANHKLCVDRIKELEADIADRIRYTAELEGMVTELDEENEKLTIQIKINKNYIKNLEKEILKQRQTLKNKDEYISILHDDATLYTTMKTRLQNNQLKDKLNRISAIVNED